MPTTSVRLSGTTFLILEPGDNLSMPLMFVLLRSRLIPSLCSGSLLTGMDFLETLLLLFSTVLVLPTLYLLLRAGLPVVEGTEVFLSLIELPIREILLELIRLVELPTGDLCVLGTFVFLVLIILPMRELLPELIRLPELPAGGLCVLGTVVFLVLIILPIRELLSELIRLVEIPTCGFVLRTLGFLVLIILPIRELLLELIRLAELPACGCVLRTLGILVLIKLPIRDVALELIRLPELAAVCLPVPELTAVGFLLPIKMLEGLRVLEVIPCRLVTGVLTVILLD